MISSVQSKDDDDNRFFMNVASCVSNKKLCREICILRLTNNICSSLIQNQSGS